ncbi:MAG: DUF4340 domain-containing protein [Chthoniobacteraceae bacterium]|nr:DUF4340 domain-containing protein [Chthoniobacteraceae bacterium]
MNTKTTILLLAAAILLVGFIAFFEVKLPKSWQAAGREKYALVFDRNRVTGIDIQSNEDKVELRKRGDQWVMESPVKDRVSAAAIQEILTHCESLEKEPVAGCRNADKKQLKAFGVTKPAVRIKLVGEEMPPELLFGKETAVEGKLYIRLEGSNTVSVASNELRNLIMRKPDEFRERQLADFNADKVLRVSVKTAAGEIDVVREAGSWRVNKPLRAQAEASKVNAFLNSVLYTKITAFLPENSANLNSYGLSEPRASLTFYVQGQARPVTMEIGARDEKTGGIYGRISTRGAVFLLPKASENILGLQPNDLRDRRLVHVDMDQTDRITLRPEGKPAVIFQRKLEEWTVRSDSRRDTPAPANRAKILQFVMKLQNHLVAAFVTDVASDLAKYGLDQPRLRVVFSAYASENTSESNAGELPLVTVAFGKTEGDLVYARVENESSVVTVDKSLLDGIPLSPGAWRTLALFRCRPAEIYSLCITPYSDGIQRQSLKLAMRSFNWIADDKAPPGILNRGNIQGVVNVLANLNAQQWTDESGPLTPAMVVEFAATNNRTGKLTLAAPDEDGSCLGTFQGQTGIFRFGAPEGKALRQRLIDPLIQ